MPTYEYVCTACKHPFEKFQRMSEDPVAPCPECNAPAERKLSGGAGLLFKGSGFYITDYRSDNYKKSEKSEGGSSGGKSESSSSKSESKSESKESKSSSKSEPKSESKSSPKSE